MADPAKYREEATRLRQEAIDATDYDWRVMLLQIALLYDRLAVHTEKSGHSASRAANAASKFGDGVR